MLHQQVCDHLNRTSVGAKIIDILKMREEIAEIERHLTPLTELELILEGAQKMERWAMNKMKEKGFATIEELENEVDRLRGIVLDPNQNQLMPKEEAYGFFEEHYRVLRVPFPHLLKETIEKYEWKKIPELEYPIPILPELEYNRDNRVWLGAMLDAEGSVFKTIRRYDRVDEIYRYEYLYPCVEFNHTNKEVAEKFGRLTDEEYSVEERPPPLKPYYRHIVLGIKSMPILFYARPYLIVHRDRADRIFEQFREWFSIRIESKS